MFFDKSFFFCVDNLSTTSWSPSPIRGEISSLIGELASVARLRGCIERSIFYTTPSSLRQVTPTVRFTTPCVGRKPPRPTGTPPIRGEKLYHKFQKREELFLSQNDISFVYYIEGQKINVWEMIQKTRKRLKKRGKDNIVNSVSICVIFVLQIDSRLLEFLLSISSYGDTMSRSVIYQFVRYWLILGIV